MGIYRGRTATLQRQLETAFRTAPVTPNTQLMRFSKLTMGREAELVDDPTINANPLAEKREEADSTAPASLEAVLCLNDIGDWLRMLLGAPVTTGAGPYTHTYTLSLAERPSALLELAVTEVDAAPSTRYHRHLGQMMNTMGWEINEAQQNFQAEFIGAIELRPYPVAPFDATPIAMRAKNIACKKNGRVWDGAASIGDIAKASVMFNNALEGQSLADGQEGYGSVLGELPSVSGSMDVLFTPAQLVDDALARTSKAVVLTSKNSAGDATLTVNLPSVEFDVPRIKVETSKGIVVSGLGWRAHQNVTPVTVVLVNGVATYAT